MEQNGLEALRQEISRRFDAVAEILTQMGQRTDARFEAVAEMFVQFGQRMDARFDAVDRRLDRIENRLTALEFQTAGTQRWMDAVDRATPQILATQTAQQKALDDLAARITRIEQRLGS